MWLDLHCFVINILNMQLLSCASILFSYSWITPSIPTYTLLGNTYKSTFLFLLDIFNRNILLAILSDSIDLEFKWISLVIYSCLSFSAAVCEERYSNTTEVQYCWTKQKVKLNYIFFFTLNTNTGAHKGGANADVRYIRREYVHLQRCTVAGDMLTVSQVWVLRLKPVWD